MPEITREQMVEWLKNWREELEYVSGDNHDYVSVDITKQQAWRGMKIIDAILAALEGPGEEEPKQYRCEGCGKWFDKKLFSHSRTGLGGDGNPIEIECGPITEMGKGAADASKD